MRRLLFVVIVLAGACNHAKPSGPAWPQMAKTEPEEDGGESIAPRESVASVIEKSAEPEAKKPAEPEADKPAATATPTDDNAAPAATPPAPSTDDVINTEEIIIEIDDD